MSVPAVISSLSCALAVFTGAGLLIPVAPYRFVIGFARPVSFCTAMRLVPVQVACVYSIFPGLL